jgi:hypothetical protein
MDLLMTTNSNYDKGGKRISNNNNSSHHKISLKKRSFRTSQNSFHLSIVSGGNLRRFLNSSKESKRLIGMNVSLLLLSKYNISNLKVSSETNTDTNTNTNTNTNQITIRKIHKYINKRENLYCLLTKSEGMNESLLLLRFKS